jgi:hypothetical protein
MKMKGSGVIRQGLLLPFREDRMFLPTLLFYEFCNQNVVAMPNVNKVHACGQSL